MQGMKHHKTTFPHAAEMEGQLLLRSVDHNFINRH